MEEFEGSRFEAAGNTFKRKRTQTYRRPKPEVSELSENFDQESLSSTPVSDDAGKISSDENAVDANPKRKVFNLNQCGTRSESDNSNALCSNGGSIDAREGGNEKKLRKVKLKFGGVTRTIQPKSKSNSDEDDDSLSLDKKTGLQGIPWKDFSKGGFIIGKENEKNEKSDGARKSRRAPKRRVLDGDFDEYDDDDDDEIRYLEKLKTGKAVVSSRDSDDDSSRSKKHKSLSKVFEEDPSLLRSGKDSVLVDTDYQEEDSVSASKRETTLTSRQRALLSGRDSASAGTQIEFPNGLPPVAPRKQKEKLTELEQQLKKAEAAERRRIQNEKAARESEAEAIRKILGQDSSRKKREDKLRKRQQELSREKDANAKTLAPNTIRTVIGPTGTTVAFAQDIGLPRIFDPKPSCYPPSREKCAGPACTNAYKYRDSKSKLPLCSLQCYKAVHEMKQAETCC